jgi:hypothetical protein
MVNTVVGLQKPTWTVKAIAKNENIVDMLLNQHAEAASKAA